MNNQSQKYTPLVCQAIFRGELPESAIGLPIIEVVHTTRTVGSGESTNWYQHCIIRRDGKLVWQGMPGQLAEKLSQLCGHLQLAGKLNKRQIYVETL